MTPDNIEKLKKIVSENLGVGIEALQDQADFQSDLNADRLELTDLLKTIESHFNIELENKSSIATFGDLIKSFQEALDTTL